MNIHISAAENQNHNHYQPISSTMFHPPNNQNASTNTHNNSAQHTHLNQCPRTQYQPPNPITTMSAGCLNPHELFALLMLLLNQIMASLIREGLVWVYMLSTCKFIQQTSYTSGLHYMRHIVSSLLRRLPWLWRHGTTQIGTQSC
jgi:hypothetical protein